MCDSDNNNCGCAWDGGDCCGDDNVPLDKLTNNCAGTNDIELCTCLDPFYIAPDCPNSSVAETQCTALWIDDGICDDENNNCKCGWDGGDCCGNDSSFLHCNECVCYVENEE
jgi:hypothetical protein